MIERFEKFTKEVALAGKCIAKIKAHEMKRFDLRGGCVMCLFFIWQYPEGLTAAELGKLCGEDKSGVSRALSTLRGKGYIDAPDEGKKYRTRYKITEAGREVCASVENAILRAVTAGGEKLSERERTVFYNAFEKINGGLVRFCESLE